MDLKFRPLIERIFVLGECAIFDEREDRFLFCSIEEEQIHSVTLQGTDLRTWNFPSHVGSFGLTESGRWIVALRDRVILFDPRTGAEETVATFPMPADMRLNDGRVGPDGAFWVGSMHCPADRRPIGSLYRIAPDGTVEEKVQGVKVSNGLAFSPGGAVMYYSDSTACWVDRWDFDRTTGVISNRRRFATLDEETGKPDGAACDAEGHYWSAGVSSMHLNRFAPDGRLVARYPVPGSPTMPCFAGKDRRTLIVTSLTAYRPKEVLERYPLTGTTFIADVAPPAAGLPEYRFRDA